MQAAHVHEERGLLAHDIFSNMRMPSTTSQHQGDMFVRQAELRNSRDSNDDIQFPLRAVDALLSQATIRGVVNSSLIL